jgi:hypothetical protein
MAPARKKRTAPKADHRFHFRLSPDTAERLAKKAERERKSINQIANDELARIPYLENVARLAEVGNHFEVMLEKSSDTFGRYRAEIDWLALSRDLLTAVDEALQADDSNNAGELRAKLAKLRAVRTDMRNHERGEAAKREALSKRRSAIQESKA